MNLPLSAASTIFRITFALLMAMAAVVLLNGAKSGSVSAPQESPDSKKQPIENKTSRRLFENRIPEHLPIRVKIRREKERLFRDLNNENWARDFELEVKNIGNKPIYFLWLDLLVPDAKIATSHQVFSVVYGRLALGDLSNQPTAEDVPIAPGETKILKLGDTEIRGWDQARAAGLVPRSIRGAKLVFGDLSFGDGTGFEGTTGTPRSKADKLSQRTCMPPSDHYGGLRKTRVPETTMTMSILQTHYMPALSSRLHFFMYHQWSVC